MRGVVEQQEGVFEEPGADDQHDRDSEQAGLQAEPEQYREDGDQQQWCHMERQQQGAEGAHGLVHARRIIGANTGRVWVCAISI